MDHPSSSSHAVPVMLFPLGQIVITSGAMDVLTHYPIAPQMLLLCHVTGEWGDLDDEDQEANRAAIKYGTRILSSHIINADEKIWIITEADRSVTTILLPSEY